ncbi:MAG TPA: Gfo/Idh/MocA family oxidoreductase [Candidatus Obscuribacterales bacterium]
MKAEKRPVEAVLIGAGERGTFVFGEYAMQHPDELKIVAVAEPVEEKRRRFAERHQLVDEQCYSSWEELFAKKKNAQAAIIATLDRLHVEPAVAALQQGYHVLLEKPMAVTPEDCVKIVRASEKAQTVLMIAHVLRYTPFFSTLHKVIASGRLGEIVAIEHRENVSYWHMAHSFVRGNWRNSEQTAPMILAKCCHDLDILTWMMGSVRPRRVQSMGSLMHFIAKNAPPDAPDRCTDGCSTEDTCAFSAIRFYLDPKTNRSCVSALGTDTSPDGRLKALQTGPYGLCVYKTDNNVVDHQSVNIEFENGTIATLIMHGHSHAEGRTMRYDGTRATLRGTFPFDTEPEITIYDHVTGEEQFINIPPAPPGGHGGGDTGLIKAFVQTLSDEEQMSSNVLTSAEVSLTSHLLAFAAEKARLSRETIDMTEYLKLIESCAKIPERVSNQ